MRFSAPEVLYRPFSISAFPIFWMLELGFWNFFTTPSIPGGCAFKNVGAGTKGDGCEFKRGRVMWRLELSLGRGLEEA